MASIFKKFQDYTKSPNRYSFDMSYNNNFTTQFGRLTPVFCQEVISGDSVQINPVFGLNFAPFMYPVQTKIKAHLHFFYVRNRALWKDWMDFIGNTKQDLVPPYIDFKVNKHLLKDGSLADYFGLPTSYVKPTGLEYVTLPITTGFFDTISDSFYNGSTTQISYEGKVYQNAQYITNLVGKNLYDGPDGPEGVDLSPTYVTLSPFTPTPMEQKATNSGLYNNALQVTLGNPNNDSLVFNVRLLGLGYYEEEHGQRAIKSTIPISGNLEIRDNQGTIYLNQNAATWLNDIRYSDDELRKDRYVFLVFDPRPNLNVYSKFQSGPEDLNTVRIPYINGVGEHVSAEDNKFYTENLQPISALPFRAYEAIYNSFYRNPQNNPLIVDGQPEYNKWVVNTEGGKDRSIYNFYNRNWDDDVFTTAVQSPQQGFAPLVGVTSYGLMTFQDENGTYEAQAHVASDGDTIESISIKSPDMPTTTARALVDMVSSGISISDFRSVNALQRWLEKNMRRGLRYKDQMESHFGVKIKYDELLMPEFIGGISQTVDVNRVINQTASENSPLGSFGGLAQAFGGSDNKITHYADEHGFIIGILSVVPYAAYSQTLPRMFTRFNVLDYFTPEFNHIGMQPVYNKDLCPLQVAQEYSGTSNEQIKKQLNAVFGYNRPYFDYVSKLDEVHGNFRNNYRDYILHRVFASTPYLSPDFTTVSESDLNDVFAVVEDEEELGYSDKIVGLIHFDYIKKTTVSEFAIPRLEN